MMQTDQSNACSVIWERAAGVLREDLSQTSYQSYIHPLQPVRLSGNRLTLQVPSARIRDMVSSRYEGYIVNALRHAASGEEILPQYVLPDEPPTADAVPVRSGHAQLNPRYTFDSFVVGGGNQLAHAASIGAANAPGRQYNPLYLHSGTGLGKTHLMHAIGNAILSRNPGAHILYITTENFINNLISAMMNNRQEDFRNRFRNNVDVLLLDDVQFFSNRSGATQEELFHTFNDLYESGKQIVLTSDKPPKDIPSLEDRLRSRFTWGMIADISPPDFETRVAILMNKARANHMELDDDVIGFIASHVESNIRELEGSLTRVEAYAALTGKNIDLALAQAALTDYFSARKKPKPTPALIQQTVCRYFNISSEDLTGKRRTREVVRPRQIAMYIMYKQLAGSGISTLTIGRIFDRDHTTVLSAFDRIEQLLQDDASVREAVEDITKIITE